MSPGILRRCYVPQALRASGLIAEPGGLTTEWSTAHG